MHSSPVQPLAIASPCAPGDQSAHALQHRWLACAEDLGHGGTDMVLILPDSARVEGPGIYRAKQWVDLWTVESRPVAAEALTKAHDQGKAQATVGRIDDAGGVSVWDLCLSQTRNPDVIVAAAHDVSERVSLHEQLRHVAYRDGLTGLLNRVALRETLDAYVATAKRDGGSVALLMLDLDNFKLINDTLGHDAGDAVLVETAARLRAATAQPCAIGRLGGDEFAVLRPSPEASICSAFFAEDLLEALREPVIYKGRALDTRASIGIATYPHHGEKESELLKNADIALYAAKSFGRGCFTTYVPAMGNALQMRALSVASVREAVAQRRLQVLYQPRVDFGSGRPIGHEAVVRLLESDGTTIPPRSITVALDDIDLAREIGDLLFERVASDVRKRTARATLPGRIALNVSAGEFRAGDFAARFLDKLRRANLSPELFEIEVAETVLVGRGTDYVAVALADLAEAGVRASLDEFGTGKTSLIQLKQMPFQAIKLDQAFVDTLQEDSADQAIVRAIASLAEGLGIEMSALGVATAGQKAALQKLGCTSGQGDFFGPAIDARALCRTESAPSKKKVLPDQPHERTDDVRL